MRFIRPVAEKKLACLSGVIFALFMLVPMPGTLLSQETAENWRSVRILDLNAMPWTSPPGRPAGWKFKNIHTIPATGGGAELVSIPPRWSTKSPRHYDKENGWYFFLAGRAAVAYYKNPQDQVGTVHTPRSGILFYGVEGAIHGFDERTSVPEGCVLLSWHDRRPSIEPVPFDSEETTFRGGPWPYPDILDTREMPWEESQDGVLVRPLYHRGDAQVEMRFYPAGWKSSGALQFADYDRWLYVLEGDLNLKVYAWPGDRHGKAMRATKGQVVEIPAHSLFGGSDTVESGAIGVWLLAWREQPGTLRSLE